MSRCFPFPPPGYTRNTKVEDLDLLKKEKHKEKKHKKDKEKKDTKEKHEKDKSDGKHKEKKDKKEKHRDKKKDKDWDKANHKSGTHITPDDKRNVGLCGTHNIAPFEKTKIKENDGGANMVEKRFYNGEHVSKIYNPAFENRNNSPIVENGSFRNDPELGEGRMNKERSVNGLHLKHNSTYSKEIEITKLFGKIEKIRDKEVGDRDKRMEKGSKSDVKVVEPKYMEQSKIVDNGENHMAKSNVKERCIKETSSAQNGWLQNGSRDGNRDVVSINNLGKRKDVGFNGSYDEHSGGPNKLAKTTTSSFPQNGRASQLCQSSPCVVDGEKIYPFNVKVEKTFSPHNTQNPSMNVKVDGKERKLNGTVARKPHPDSKYLNHVLSVPKMDDWLGDDDQEWLFNSNNSSDTRKPKVDSCEIDPTPQVWDTALWLDPVGVYALPYVIPR